MYAFSFRLVAALLLFAIACCGQGLQVCLSVHGVAAGVDNSGAPSRLTAVLGGVATTIFPVPGSPGPAVSAAHEAAFLGAGYVTVRVNPNEFCIIAGPGGAPIVAGAAYGTTDPGLGLDNKIRRIPVPPPAPLPELKDNGALVAMPELALPPMPFAAQVQIDIFLLDVPLPLPVNLVLPPGLPGPLLQDFMQQELDLLGFLGNRVVIEDPMNPGNQIDALQLERTPFGESIVGCEVYWDAAAQQIMPTVIGCGLHPIFGACEYGLPTQNFALQEPFSLCFGQPQVGGQFDIVHELHYPFGIYVNAIALDPAPFAINVFDGFLLVDPGTMVLEAGLTDPLGGFVRPWLIPPDPMLAGFQLATQGVALDPTNQFTFSTGMQVRLHP